MRWFTRGWLSSHTDDDSFHIRASIRLPAG